MKPSTQTGISHRFPSYILAGLLLCLIAIFSVLNSAAGENKRPKPYALIFGTVWGPDSRPLYAVKVRVRRADETKSRWELYSDRNGEFAFRLPAAAADYVVWADLKGYKSSDSRPLQPGDEIKVRIENDERADISLHLKY